MAFVVHFSPFDRRRVSSPNPKKTLVLLSHLKCHIGKISPAHKTHVFKPFPKIPGFYVSAIQVFGKHCGKRRNCLQRAISPPPPPPPPPVFSTYMENFLPFLSNLKLSSASSFCLEESKIFRIVMG